MTLLQQRIIHFVKFSSISVIGTLLEYVIFYFVVRLLDSVMNDEKFADGIATAFCYILAAVFCYVMNKIFVYKTHTKSITEVLKYFAIAIPKLILTTALVPYVIYIFSISDSFLKTVINSIIQTILFFAGYALQTIWVFKKNSVKKA